MTSVRAAKSKGSQFEYDCQASLEQKYYEVIRTAERGYQRQYDLHVRCFKEGSEYLAFECKRLKGISWNQLEKYYKKLEKVTNNYDIIKNRYILFKSNFQPCLVFDGHGIFTFENYFRIPFIKHESTRVKKV